MAPALLLLLPCLLAGCYVKVDKSKNGEDKNVEVHLPVGGIEVKQDQPSAAEIALPSYPGATLLEDKGDKPANVHVGFGNWQVNVNVAKYQSSDPQPKIASFYRTALGHFGDVLECRNGHAVGAMTTTREGLGCHEQHSGSKGMHIAENVNIDDDENEFSLRAGSKRHQHIVAIKPGDNGGTRFTLLRLDLPADIEQGDQQE